MLSQDAYELTLAVILHAPQLLRGIAGQLIKMFPGLQRSVQSAKLH